jgi:hypothetical protein
VWSLHRCPRCFGTPSLRLLREPRSRRTLRVAPCTLISLSKRRSRSPVARPWSIYLPLYFPSSVQRADPPLQNDRAEARHKRALGGTAGRVVPDRPYPRNTSTARLDSAATMLHVWCMLLRPEYLSQNLDQPLPTKDGRILRTIRDACDYTTSMDKRERCGRTGSGPPSRSSPKRTR